MRPPATNESDFRLREDDSQKPENQKNRHNPPSQSHCHSLRRHMRAQDLHYTNGYQATLLATVQSANPMGCVAKCENYCTSAEMLTLQFCEMLAVALRVRRDDVRRNGALGLSLIARADRQVCFSEN